MPTQDAPRVIRTAYDAIEELGGAEVVAELFGLGANAVRNWYKRGLPPHTYLVLAPRLRARGHDFSDNDLFQQYRAKFKRKKAKATGKRR